MSSISYQFQKHLECLTATDNSREKAHEDFIRKTVNKGVVEMRQDIKGSLSRESAILRGRIKQDVKNYTTYSLSTRYQSEVRTETGSDSRQRIAGSNCGEEFLHYRGKKKYD